MRQDGTFESVTVQSHNYIKNIRGVNYEKKGSCLQGTTKYNKKQVLFMRRRGKKIISF